LAGGGVGFAGFLVSTAWDNVENKSFISFFFSLLLFLGVVLVIFV
jgi:hypothetical protein